MMITVVIAMIPCLLFGIWNTGHQYYLATGQNPVFINEIFLGLKKVLPIIIVSYTVGGLVEVIFAIIRKHPINEGFLVTGMLIPLVMPVTIPLWQVALATIFAVVIAKEIFGGTGMNIWNVALSARAFLYFAYPQQISGDIWTYLGNKTVVDAYSMATPLALAAGTHDNNSVVEVFEGAISGAAEGMFSFSNLFIGIIPGSIGETSTLMCLIGALILIITGVGSWKIIVSVFAGTYMMGLLLNAISSNPIWICPHIIIW